MRDNDQQLGKPMRVYRNTEANIEAMEVVGKVKPGEKEVPCPD